MNTARTLCHALHSRSRTRKRWVQAEITENTEEGIHLKEVGTMRNSEAINRMIPTSQIHALLCDLCGNKVFTVEE